MCMSMTINPNVGHVTTSSESIALLPLHTFIHPLQNGTLTVAWSLGLGVLEIIQRSFSHLCCNTCLGLSLDWLPDIYDVCVYLLSIELHDDCQMLWAWPEEHFGAGNCIMLASPITWTPRMLFLESIEILSTRLPRRSSVLVLQNLHALLYLKSWKSTASWSDIYRCNFFLFWRCIKHTLLIIIVSKAFSQNCSYNPDVFSFNCFLLLLSYIVNIQLHLHLNSISEFKSGTWVTQ
jgi:hypothetical protein